MHIWKNILRRSRLVPVGGCHSYSRLAIVAGSNRFCKFCSGAYCRAQRRRTRNPILLFWLYGLLLLRLATVALEASLFQLPPRLTRLVPEAAPTPYPYLKSSTSRNGHSSINGIGPLGSFVCTNITCI